MGWIDLAWDREMGQVRTALFCVIYSASGGNFLLTFWGNLSVPFQDPEDGTYRLSRNVGNKLSLVAA